MYFLILSEKNPGFRQTFSPRMSKLKKSTWQVKFPGKKTFLGKKIDLLYLLMFFLSRIWLARKLRVCQEGILRPRLIIRRDNFLEETKSFKPLKFERKRFVFLAKQQCQSCQKCLPCVQGNTLGIFLEKIIVLTLFFDFEWRKSQFLTEVFAKLVKSRNLCDRENILKKVFLE